MGDLSEGWDNATGATSDSGYMMDSDVGAVGVQETGNPIGDSPKG